MCYRESKLCLLYQPTDSELAVFNICIAKLFLYHMKPNFFPAQNGNLTSYTLLCLAFLAFTRLLPVWTWFIAIFLLLILSLSEYSTTSITCSTRYPGSLRYQNHGRHQWPQEAGGRHQEADEWPAIRPRACWSTRSCCRESCWDWEQTCKSYFSMLDQAFQ